MSWQVGLYVAAVLIPLAAFTVELLFIRQLKRWNAYIATAAVGLSFLLSLVGFAEYYFIESQGVFSGVPVDRPLVWEWSADWVLLAPEALEGIEGPPTRGLSLPIGVYVDNVTVVMFLMVTLIATLIHVYSIGYMSDDPRFSWFFMYLSLFCFSMLGLLAAPNLFMIFVFWELVGICSYFLIGFWREEKKNVDAANKAFIVNRVGDVGMLVGLGLLWAYLGTFSFQEINEGLRDDAGGLHVAAGVDGEKFVECDLGEDQPSRSIPYWVLTIAGLGIFAGCVGKSAQVPLHVWLPDAMAGPTPVSALIHAATMVAAGVYLVARFLPVFTPEVALYIAYTGGVTLVIAATIAMVQTDFKKVLAYSTVSQLGFMMLALGVGGRAAGLFHLLTHAFFKALLFLGAGSVHHAVGTYEMPRLGGLGKRMPITAMTMLIGTLAISGTPFFSGFYSKDAILAAALARIWDSPEHALLFVLPVLGAILTALYMFRMWFLVFAGEPHWPIDAPAAGPSRDPHPTEHAHESGVFMAAPLVILAFFSVFVGWTIWAGVPVNQPILERMLSYGEPPGHVIPHWTHWPVVGASLVILMAGAGLAMLYYAPAGLRFFPSLRLNPARAAKTFRPLYVLFVNKWWFDEAYDLLFVRPCLALARICRNIDKILIDGFLDGSAAAVAAFSRLNGLFDKFGVDGLVNGAADAVYLAGDQSRSIQTGRVRNYLMFLAAALVGIFAGVFAWVGG